MKLTGSQIRYLLTIKKLNDSKHVIKSVDVANELNYSRASVHKMLVTLKEMNIIQQKYYGYIYLTSYGSRTATDCQKKYDKVKETLMPVIKIKDDYNLGVCGIVEMMQDINCLKIVDICEFLTINASMRFLFSVDQQSGILVNFALNTFIILVEIFIVQSFMNKYIYLIDYYKEGR